MLDRPALLGVVRSATARRWVGPSAEVERLGRAIAQTAGLPEIVGRVLAARGVEPDQAPVYLAPTLRDLMPDPSTLADMDVAAERLVTAVRSHQRIAIFGDYDVDGASSAAMLHDWLAALGIAATVHIPDRLAEGYGPNGPAMQRLAQAHDLILCVDCGTVAHEPLAVATKAGAEVVVIDHHQPGEALPAVTAVVNPNRHDCPSGLGQLCAAGVVFLLLVAANRLLRAGGTGAPDLMPALDLAAVATVADVAPLTGLNRAFVRQGLAVMAGRSRPGLAALADVAGLSAPPRSVDHAVVLGPRLNAGGRVGDAALAVRLLTATCPSEARILAAELEAMNVARRRIEAEVTEAAFAEAEARIERTDGACRLAWAAGEGWHPGVVGIVASRLRERFDRPAVVIAVRDGHARGSARSVPGVDIGAAIAAVCRDGLLSEGGGHAMAAGLGVAADAVEAAMAALERRLAREGEEAAHGAPLTLGIDALVAPSAATPDLVSALEAAGPYGQSSPPPRVAVAGVVPQGTRLSERGHLSLRLAVPGGGPALSSIAFGAGANGLAPLLEACATRRAPVHVAGRLEVDDWGGRRRAKLRIEDAAEPV
ncbi:MAG: single-stranded-DNA-specific exonuclease RecJ [Pseudomonadota bacterium]